ncbi:MAG TPA: carbohydrate kinase family protein, partial [Gaiellaceae bacterium]|nr:carbohydrate kinase family protein [Gaiellaceae bacterium]
PAAAVGKVGGDTFGDFVLDLFDERSVERTGVIRDPSLPTSATVVLVSGDGERTFLHLPGANGRVRRKELDEELLYRGRCLHVAGTLVLEMLDGEPLAAILAEARRRGLVTSLDTVFDASGRWARLEPSLPHLDLAVPSLDEARAISGEQEPARVAAWLRDHGVRAVALTMGPDGCYAAGDDFEGIGDVEATLALAEAA